MFWEGASIITDMITKYGFTVTSFDENISYLTNQIWKLIPMKENNEDWEKQLDTLILEISGFNEIFIESPYFLQLLAKLEGIKIVNPDFCFYRKTVFEAIGLLRRLCQ